MIDLLSILKIHAFKHPHAKKEIRTVGRVYSCFERPQPIGELGNDLIRFYPVIKIMFAPLPSL